MSLISVDGDDIATVAEFVAKRSSVGDEAAQDAAGRLLDRLLKPPQRAPVCSDEACGISIKFIPKSGWGNSTGEWVHLTVSPVPGHQPRPKVLIDPAPRPRDDP